MTTSSSLSSDEKKNANGLPLGPTADQESALLRSKRQQQNQDNVANSSSDSPKNDDDDNHMDWWTEVRLLLELAFPTMLLNIGFAASPVLTASVVGREFGATHLSAFTLANLTGNLCIFSFNTGLYSASDTLSPQAFGIGNYKEVGLIAMRGFAISMTILVPMNVFLVCFLKEILVAIGQDSEASDLAQQWYRIFVLALPFSTLSYTMERFLSAQATMKPLVVVTLLSCCIVLPVGLQIFTKYFGFLGSAMAYVFYRVTSAGMLLSYLKIWQPHVAGTWPGIGAWREALEKDKLIEYLSLGMGGVLGQSEWVYWETLSLIVGRLGVVPLTAHTIPNTLIFALVEIPYSTGVALTIRMGTVISESATRAKSIASVTLITTVVLFGLASAILYIHADFAISLFTFEPDVIALTKTIWWKVCLYNVNSAVFNTLLGVAAGLGMQWVLGVVTFVFLWIVGIPVTVYHALVLGGGLDATWTWISAPYLAINMALLVIFANTNWNSVREKVRQQSTTEPCPSIELEESNLSSQVNPNLDERMRLLAESRPPYD